MTLVDKYKMLFLRIKYIHLKLVFLTLLDKEIFFFRLDIFMSFELNQKYSNIKLIKHRKQS